MSAPNGSPPEDLPAIGRLAGTPTPTLGRAWLWIPILTLLAAALALAASGRHVDVFLWINRLSHGTGPHIWMMLTSLSDGVVTAALLFPWVRRYPRQVFALLVAGLAFTLFSVAVKEGLNLPRPGRALPDGWVTIIGPDYGKRSFPSGHTAMAFAAAGVLGLSQPRAAIRLAWLAAASLLGLSRIVVGVHWPLDVLIGAAMGWAAVPVGFAAARRWAWGYGRTAQRLYGAVMFLACMVIFFPYCGFPEIIWAQRALAGTLIAFGLREYRQLLRSPASAATESPAPAAAPPPAP
jgi:membrane-associated phospholipid phosphatase